MVSYIGQVEKNTFMRYIRRDNTKMQLIVWASFKLSSNITVYEYILKQLYFPCIR